MLAERRSGAKLPPNHAWLTRKGMGTAPRTASSVAEVLLAVGVILPACAIVAVAIVVALPYLLVAAAIVVAFALLASFTLK
jgi:hypothetical protein